MRVRALPAFQTTGIVQIFRLYCEDAGRAYSALPHVAGFAAHCSRQCIELPPLVDGHEAAG
jgi:hypothetical protein